MIRLSDSNVCTIANFDQVHLAGPPSTDKHLKFTMGLMGMTINDLESGANREKNCRPSMKIIKNF